MWQLPDPASDPGVAVVHSLRISYLGPGRVCEADVFLVFKPYILVLDLVWVGGGRLVDRLRWALVIELALLEECLERLL